MARENGFENKRVVIVGSSGIGLAVAEEAASQGADVVMVAMRSKQLPRDSLRPMPSQALRHNRKYRRKTESDFPRSRQRCRTQSGPEFG